MGSWTGARAGSSVGFSPFLSSCFVWLVLSGSFGLQASFPHRSISFCPAHLSFSRMTDAVCSGYVGRPFIFVVITVQSLYGIVLSHFSAYLMCPLYYYDYVPSDPSKTYTIQIAIHAPIRVHRSATLPTSTESQCQRSGIQGHWVLAVRIRSRIYYASERKRACG